MVPPTGPFPDATNTGYAAAPDYPGHLNACPGTILSNTTYNFIDCPGGIAIGSSGTHVTNVTIHGGFFHGAGDLLVAVFGDNITLDYCTLSPDVGPPVSYAQGYQYGIAAGGPFNSVVGKFTLSHSNIWGFGNATDVNGSTQAKPQVFTDNYVHDARDDGGIDHTDGLGQEENTSNGSYVTVNHNTIVSAGNTNGISYQFTTGSTADHFTVTNNYISGWGYSVNLNGGAGMTNSLFSGNVFGTDIAPIQGPLYGWVDSSNTWKCNKIAFVPGTTWTDGQGWHPTAAEDGLFWLPLAGDPSSATDYHGNATCP